MIFDIKGNKRFSDRWRMDTFIVRNSKQHTINHLRSRRDTKKKSRELEVKIEE